ncbi:hypothetical protein BV20DRAFT_965345 [Pilatotrama ljubarskyi]|nr:hypothetical protein BV20DRAFT_965345 [Pilatotrama ljubarskyi]
MSRASSDRSVSTHSASLSRLAAKINRRRLSDITLANVLAGHTCSPISLVDFEAYLALKEHSLENLHFAVWYQSYRTRYFALVSPPQPYCKARALHFAIPSPVRTAQRTVESRRQSDAVSCPAPSPTISAFSTDDTISRRGSGAPLLSSTASRFPKSSSRHQPNVASDRAAQWKSFREESALAAATFLSPGSPQEIILDGEVRDALLRELTWNIHPDAFLSAYEAVVEALETYSMPRFLAYASANINRPKQIYWYSLGFLDMLLSVALAVLLIVLMPSWMSEASRRAWRLTAVPLFSLGSMQAYSAWRGFCSEVWGRGNTQLREWELERSDPELASATWASIVPSDAKPSPRPHVQENVIALPSVFEDDEREGRLSREHPSRASMASVRSQASANDSCDDRGAHLNLDRDVALQRPREYSGNDIEKQDELRFECADDASPSAVVDTTQCKPAVPEHEKAAASFDPWGWEKAQVTQQKSWEQGTTRYTARTTAKAEYRRPPVFGPERPVLDPRIREVHRAVMRDMLAFGFVCTAVFTIVLLAVPSVHGS